MGLLGLWWGLDGGCTTYHRWLVPPAPMPHTLTRFPTAAPSPRHTVNGPAWVHAPSGLQIQFVGLSGKTARLRVRR